MAAIDTLAVRDAVLHQLARRNWASENPGPMVVFCIVGVVGIFLIGLYFYRLNLARQARKPAF
ncbi:hypothetical protein B0I35DRAFT_475000 [Stachybotrys elegans]|uniref:Uncharacterized protein n=1 Tax=Stachybotrys elegans TaxID=80388 RepID=A0A8K0WWY0_9HYPO|nr:hypothetical protein B0I35DRAFT_475000 [Stachybotrys elegans]